MTTKTKIGLLLGHNNDLVFVDGRLALVTGADLVRQRWQQRARSFKGEWVLDKNAGIPYFQEIFKKGTTERRIKEIFRNMSNATEGVLRTIDISPGVFDRKTRKLSDLKVKALIDGEEGEDLASFVFGGDVYPIGTDINKPIVPRPDDPISVSWFRYVQNNTTGTRWTDYAQFGSGAGIGLADGAHGIQILNTGVRSIALGATPEDKRSGELIFTGAGVSQDGNTFTFSGGAVAYTASRGIELDSTGTDFRHINAVEAKTEALYPIAYDAQGHITASGSAVTSLKNPYNLVLKVKSGTTEGTDLYTYDGSAAKTLDFKQGSNITLTEAAGSVTIAATNTTYPLTQGHIAYGNGTGITGEAALFWDSTNKRVGLGTETPEAGVHIVGTDTFPATLRSDCYSATATSAASVRFYKSAGSSGFNALASGDIIGRIVGLGAKTSGTPGFVTAGNIDFISAGSWASSAGEITDLRVQLRHAGTSATRLLLTSRGGLGLGQHVTNDWTMGHFLASQMLDGSTAGSSQSIVAMTLGLRTTSTTANQVLKLTSSDSASPLVLQAGYLYTFMVNISATFESGDVFGVKNSVYYVTAYYKESGAIDRVHHYESITGMGAADPGSFNISVTSEPSGTGDLKITFSPGADCSVDNPVNVIATIFGGTKIKTNAARACGA